MKDTLILLMGVSGSGKTTLMTELLQAHSRLMLIPSYTTRPMRVNEKNGRKYWHISEQEFKKSVDAGEFLEYAVYSRNYYGTKISEINRAFSKSLIPITEIEMHGLEKIKKDNKGIRYVSIFLNLSDDKMTGRITNRGTIDKEEIGRRVLAAQEERVKAGKLCNYVLDTNNTLKNNIKNLNQLVKDILNS